MAVAKENAMNLRMNSGFGAAGDLEEEKDEGLSLINQSTGPSMSNFDLKKQQFGKRLALKRPTSPSNAELGLDRQFCYKMP